MSCSIKTTKKEYWDSLTPKERRIAIAEDVLERLRLGRLNQENVRRGYQYFEYEGKIPNPTETPNSHKLAAMEDHCHVCARGALLLSRMRLFNGLTYDKIGMGKTGARRMYHSNRDHTSNGLRHAFNKAQLALIECAFERTTSHRFHCMNDASGCVPLHEAKSAVAFGNRYVFDDERLDAIMENIIENDGDFKPWASKQ